MILNGCPANYGGRCFVNGYEDCNVANKNNCRTYRDMVLPMEARIEPPEIDTQKPGLKMQNGRIIEVSSLENMES